MDPLAVHEQLADLVPALACFGSDGASLAVEAHVEAGCSRCARALTNASEAVVGIAAAGAEPIAPPGRLRGRVLADAAAAVARRRGATPRRFFDPAGEVARLHVGGQADLERIAEIDRLALANPPAGDACGHLLAQLQSVIRFPLLFVSVVRGERVGYRAQRGLDVLLADGAYKDRRRETTFCTHTVSMAAPMVVPNAVDEPFFRGSRMVLRDGIGSYVGVPLRTSRGVVVGTLCAMDFGPRRIPSQNVHALELFSKAVAAEIERPRDDDERRAAGGAPVHPAPWFRELLRLVDEPVALVLARHRGSAALADLAHPDEPVGHVLGGHGVLIVGGEGEGARVDERCAEAQKAMPGAVEVLRGAALANYLS